MIPSINGIITTVVMITRSITVVIFRPNRGRIGNVGECIKFWHIVNSDVD